MYEYSDIGSKRKRSDRCSKLIVVRHALITRKGAFVIFQASKAQVPVRDIITVGISLPRAALE